LYICATVDRISLDKARRADLIGVGLNFITDIRLCPRSAWWCAVFSLFIRCSVEPVCFSHVAYSWLRCATANVIWVINTRKYRTYYNDVKERNT